ncbi:hypothetical protein BST61_g5516 [Cercospora zeina]
MYLTTTRQQRHRTFFQQHFENPYELQDIPSRPNPRPLPDLNPLGLAPLELDTIHAGEIRQVRPEIPPCLPLPPPPPAIFAARGTPKISSNSSRPSARLASRAASYPHIATTSHDTPSPLDLDAIITTTTPKSSSQLDTESQTRQEKKFLSRRSKCCRAPRAVIVAILGVLVFGLLLFGFGIWASLLENQGKLGVYLDRRDGECKILGGLRVDLGLCGSYGEGVGAGGKGSRRMW